MVLLYSIELPLGKFQAPDFNLVGIDDKSYSLENISFNKGLVVIFTCNHCPYAQAAWPLLAELAREYQKKGIAFVAINPNDESAYPEDSFEKMKEKAKELNLDFPYLRDATQEIARAYKAQCTPDIYVFDSKKTLYYHGRINDNWQDPAKVKSYDLKDALDSLVDGRPYPEKQFPSMGCSIKWKS